MQKLRGRGHSSAQLWQITINSLLQILHVFQGNAELWGTFTPCSKLGQELPEGYPKNLSLCSIRTKKNPTLQQLWEDAIPSSLSTAAGHLWAQPAPAGAVLCITVSPAGQQCCRSPSPSCSFSNSTMSAELNQFSGCLPTSLILQQAALRVWKGSVHILEGTQAWQAPLGCHFVSEIYLPLFSKLPYSVFYCIWWGTLKGSIEQCFCSPWLLSSNSRNWKDWCLGQLLTLLSRLLLIHSCGSDFFVNMAVHDFLWPTGREFPKNGLWGRDTEFPIICSIVPHPTFSVSQTRK